MKLTRAQFLKALPAAVLALAGCTAAPTAPADTDELVFDHAYPLDYATQFTADCYADGSTLLTIPDAQAKFLVRPEGAATLRTVPEGVTVLQQPVQNLYLVSTSVMDLFLALDALDCIALSGTRAEGWYLDEARQAMLDGRIAYAGKYSAPDYEQILAANCGLAIENTMIYHTPEVKEQLERFGIPVLVERSSYESGPLARMEWIKFYGALLGKDSEAVSYFDALMNNLTPVMNQESTGKTVAFFYVTAAGAVSVRKSSDYISKSISLAGCTPIVFEEDENAGATSSQTIQMEAFYNAAVDADMLIYNSTVDGELKDMNALLSKAPLLADCKAVKTGQVWCVTKNFYQESLALGNFILDVNTAAEDNGRELYFLKQLT